MRNFTDNRTYEKYLIIHQMLRKRESPLLDMALLRKSWITEKSNATANIQR